MDESKTNNIKKISESKKSLLIIKPDHIGDYILFRNFLVEIKKSKKFKDYKLTLFVNTRIKEIAEFFDYTVVDSFIWVDLEKFVKEEWYFNRKIQEVVLNHYDMVINAMFTYMKPIETLISAIKSCNKILIKGTSSERSLIYAQKDESRYSKIIDLSEKQVFEFERFRIAFESIIEEKIKLERPYLCFENSWQNKLSFKNDFCVLFIGADASYRKWSISYYSKVIQYLIKEYNLDVIILGGPEEIENAQQLSINLSTNKLINLVGETTLLDVIAILKQAKLVISNETGAAHISIILNTPTLVISNGNHFGKFTPYPKEYKTFSSSIYPFDFNNEDYENYLKKYYNGSRLDIHLIHPDSVISLIDDICNKYNITKKENTNVIEIIQNKNYLSPNQSRLNYNFSFMFSGIYTNLLETKNSYNKILIYGNSHFGKIAKHILGNSCIGIVDKTSHLEDFLPNSFDVFSPKILNYLNYDKILISVLGRENEIIDYLQEEFNISIDKTIILRISEVRYQLGC